MKKLDLTDLLITVGLSGIGTGVFLLFGLGYALLVTGSLLFAIGIVSTRTG